MAKNYSLDHDIYKGNTLILKKGSVINDNILMKLQNFGIYLGNEFLNVQKNEKLERDNISVLIADENDISCMKMKKTIENSILKGGKILHVSSQSLLKKLVKTNSFSFIFIDYEMFDEEILDEIFLNTKEKTNIFVTNSSSKKLFAQKYNSEQIKINFLYRTVEKEYINALIKINL